jgi:hypothetical protein
MGPNGRYVFAVLAVLFAVAMGLIAWYRVQDSTNPPPLTCEQRCEAVGGQFIKARWPQSCTCRMPDGVLFQP